jgi:hypothetical protein
MPLPLPLPCVCGIAPSSTGLAICPPPVHDYSPAFPPSSTIVNKPHEAAQQQRARPLLLQVSADKQQECAHALLRVLEAVDYPLCFFVRHLGPDSHLGRFALGPVPAYLGRFPLGPIPA